VVGGTIMAVDVAEVNNVVVVNFGLVVMDEDVNTLSVMMVPWGKFGGVVNVVHVSVVNNILRYLMQLYVSPIIFPAILGRLFDPPLCRLSGITPPVGIFMNHVILLEFQNGYSVTVQLIANSERSVVARNICVTPYGY